MIKVKPVLSLLLVRCAVLLSGCRTDRTNSGTGSTIPLKEAKLIIEHNATDKDTGFQGFIDSEGWERLEVTQS